MTTLLQGPLLKEPERLQQRLKEIPAEPGVYFMHSRRGDILYIGKSKVLRNRVRSYFRKSRTHSPRIEMMVQQVAEIEFIVTDTEAEALALEANLIKQHQPYYNVLLKDDKKYPYVCITWSEEYPRFFVTRKRHLGNKGDRYYGPYVDSRLLRYTLGLMKRVFPLRQRRKPLFKNRTCLNYDIGRCPGVCQKIVSPEEYRQTVQKVAMVFQGRSNELVETLTEQMMLAAENERFEKAAQLRDQIKAISALNADQKVSLPDDRVSRDAIALAADDHHCAIQLFQVRAGRLVGRLGFFTELPENLGDDREVEYGKILQHVLENHYANVDGIEIPSEILVQYPLRDQEWLAGFLGDRRNSKVQIIQPQRQLKADLIAMVERNAQHELSRTQRAAARNLEAMEDLATLLDLPELPKRIEGYDISHIQGSNAVASQVVFIDGVPAKQEYRRYNIKNPDIHIGRSDDFASMAEVLRRRFRKGITKDAPDLIMIDGGKGQLSSVMKVMEDLDLVDKLNIVSLAKKQEQVYFPYESEPIKSNKEQPGIQLLRRVRDESHRFAVSFHRQKRMKSSRRSQLDDIPGLGHHRKKLLLAHFHSLDYLREAKPAQIAEVKGIGDRLAEDIYSYFHPKN
ncbi:excinuclease ABC subunit UvrC [[Limnothrix rosea] IAM M-220]|uniref:excinuclease ABC subunit UvrC n=1 Tax=[Limnothrix rosea] IAM M-220 TaxID=454133 RepID=UPI0009692022|nr:excinuclease ABC subunit UvrC [[Limnothrix rosea] IAM M-220]OKH19387.1 excinuclease ABC subunit C [[Limnothrix rosea] IAM M-220]